MSKKWGSADFAELKALQERLQKLEKMDLDKFCEDCSKELAARLLSLVIEPTPVGHYEKASGKKGGTLRRGWTAETHEEAEKGNGTPSVKEATEYAKRLNITKSGDTYTIEVVNPVKYASYVEFGHVQEPGRYVPALGKKLKKAWVPGKLMLTKSEIILEKHAPALLEKKLNAMLKEIFNG